MRLSDKYSPIQMARPPWLVYEQYDVILGHVLDDKFEDPHVHVYEHTRHTYDEMFYHQPQEDQPLIIEDDTDEDLVKEEREVLSVFRVLEKCRLLIIVGDVGVGKSTFLSHLRDLHLPTPTFGDIKPIYINWAAFITSLTDPLPGIQKHFVNDVFAALETHLTDAQQVKIDDQIFRSAKMFARTRTGLLRIAKNQRMSYINRAIGDALQNDPVEFAYERLNALCGEDQNRVVLIIDNIDQLQPPVLEQLRQFLTEIQTRTTPLLIVAMRDHTAERGFSAYQREGTTLCWRMRLQAPDIRSMLNRRLDYFFPRKTSKTRLPQIVHGSFSITLSEKNHRRVCRRLLEAPFLDAKTYDFLMNWCNFNIRDLFQSLQRLLSSGAFSEIGKDFVLAKEPVVIHVDECIIALGLGHYLLYYPRHSPVFNPYAVGGEIHQTDRLVGPRILQYLARGNRPIGVAQIKQLFSEWGYKSSAIEGQLHAMANKDVIWTDAGAPEDIEDSTRVRLSYRGTLYNRQLLGRAVFNYMMSFNVRAPDETHRIARHHKGEFRAELEAFGTFGRTIDAEAVADRVLGLADVIFESEKEELEQLRSRHALSEFKSEVAPKSVAVTIVDGLVRMFQKSLNKDGDGPMVTVPSTATLERTSSLKAEYNNQLRQLVQVTGN